MAITEAQKVYRKTATEKEKRRLYAMNYQRRPEVKEKERARASMTRAAPGGAELNRKRVKDNRKKLGRNYISELVSGATGIACRNVPNDIVKLKREALLLRRLSENLSNSVNDERIENES